MKNHKIKVNNCDINYYEINSDRQKSVVFVHGNSHSALTFKDILQDKRLQNYRLIALDLPGHGNSDPLEDYSLIIFSNIFFKFVTELNLTDFICVGHSLGGHIVYESLDLLDPKAIITYGAPPIGSPPDFSGFNLIEELSLLSKGDLDKNDIAKIANSFYFINVPDQTLIDIKRTHPEMRSILAKNNNLGHFKDEISLLKNWNKQIYIVHGNKDPYINFNYIKDLSAFNNNMILHEFYNSGHNVHHEAIDNFLSIITSVLEL